jgi:uncharacterized coiled-coil protein SlyX
VKGGVLIGVVLAGVILAAWLLAPTFEATADAELRNATRQAELARRLLAQYSPEIAVAGLMVPRDELENLDAQALQEQAGAVLEAELTGTDAEGFLRQLPSRFSAGDLSAGVTGYREALSENQRLLDEALRASNTATGPTAPAFAQLVRGAALQQAGEVAALEAAATRRELAEVLRDAMEEAVRYAAIRAKSAYYEDRESAVAVEALETAGEYNVAWIGAEAEQARAAIDRLSEQIAAREAELERVQAEIDRVQAERQQLEEAGYDRGDPEAFAAYRVGYLALSQRLSQLGFRSDVLQRGVRANARFEGDDPASGALLGGEFVLGLEELHNELAQQEQRLTRFEAALADLRDTVNAFRTGQTSAQQEVTTARTRARAQRDQIAALTTRANTLANQALEQERRAVDSVTQARSSFAAATRALQQRRQNVQRIQSEKDPERQDEALRLQLGDRFLEQLGRGAEAAARVVEGRIQLQRLEGVTSYADALETIARLSNAEVAGDATQRDLIQASREAGQETLQEAIGIYNDLLQRTQETGWVSLSGLAAAQYVLAKFESNPQQRAGMEREAARAIFDATEGAENNPYLAGAVRFRDYLAEVTDYQPPRPEAEGAAPEEGAAEPAQ